MLKLRRVEIQGFKSFCDRTEMRFNGSGIAAIVGPNGCGKSNLSDAISWVLGEQSAKTLRGTRMEDVIFAGTRDRKPLGMASVTMALVDLEAQREGHVPSNGHGANGDAANTKVANGDSSAAPKPHEITITRRLFRSGESEYLIDGRTARLRDIQEIFMGTGLGPESYAIIEQGRIGQILSSKPQDRRSVVEEAAGVTKFKTRRRLAEAKLESAKQNLARVFDILEEVSRQANSLKRQAAKTRRYEELKTEMVALLRRSLAGRFRALEREAARVAQELNLAGAVYHDALRQVSDTEKGQAGIQERAYGTETELTGARARLAELQVESERTRGRLEYQAQQIGSIEQRLSQGEDDTQEIERRLTVQQQDIDSLRTRVLELDRQNEALRLRLQEKSHARDCAEAELRGQQEGMEIARQQVLRLLGEASALRNHLAQLEEFLAGMDRDTARLEKEEQIAAAELARLASIKAELSEQLNARQLDLESTTERRKKIEEELAERRGRAAQTRAQLDELRSEYSRLKARRDSLEEILSHRAYTTEAVKRLFTAIERGQGQGLEPLGVLADFVEVDAAYEKAAEEFLHDELEYVVVKSWSDAAQGVDLLRADLDGRATFLVHPAPDQLAASAPIAEPDTGPATGVLGRLTDALRMTNGLRNASAHVIPRLARCFLVQDRTPAQRLALEHPDCYFLLPDGVCYHGQAVSGGKKTGSGPLGLKRELRELHREAQSRESEVDWTVRVLEELDSETGSLTEDLERIRSHQQNQEKEALALDHEMRKLAEEFARANSRISVARMELDRIRREREQSAEQRQRNQALVEEKERARYEQEEALAASRNQLQELQTQAARAAEEHSALRAELAGMDERRRSEKSAAARLEAQAAELASRRAGLVTELRALGVERARLLADNIELDTRASALNEQIVRETVSVTVLADREQSLRAELARLDEDLKAMRTHAQEAQEARARVELELVKRQAELKYLDETSRRELSASLEELAAAEESISDEQELTEAEQRCQELRARIDALGPVNPQALEEFQEAQQRYEFLNTQRQDLLESIRDTERAIQEMDAESRKRFSQAFEAINANFRELFRTLFGGGTGEMRLTDESNAGESGIEIVASPPGKRLQNVLLLSGGEKALTALALLMAIFRYQPSPFCILDEVDAPLDEPNIERLTRLLREMSSQTQFVIITHAKRTMEAAQTLYGVTMQEPGVSKLVSVKFQPMLPPAALMPTEPLSSAAN